MADPETPASADWAPRLAAALAGAVREIAPRLGGEPVAALALDRHPWDGTLGLALLTRAEAETDALLTDPAEMAAWRWRDFAAWGPAADLGDVMRAACDAAPEAGDRPAAAAAFLHACADALQSAPLGDALAGLTRADGFRLSAAHPDDGREFVPLPH